MDAENNAKLEQLGRQLTEGTEGRVLYRCKTCEGTAFAQPGGAPDHWVSMKIRRQGRVTRLGVFCSAACLVAFVPDIGGLAPEPSTTRSPVA